MTEVSVYLTPDEVKAALTSDEIVADLTGEEVKTGITTDGLWNWLPGWSKRIKIILDHNDIDAALSNFPHLVYLSASSGHSNKDVSCVFDELGSDANRKKIAITKSDGLTECYVEIDKWDDANEKAWLWVKVPDADPDEDTFLWLYYDSAHADNDTYVGDPSDAVVHNVWDANFKLVTHMRDDPDTSHIRDSTVNANDGTKLAADEPIEADGIIGKAQELDGTNDWVQVFDSPSVSPTAALTLGAWVKTSEAHAATGVITKGPDGGDYDYMLYFTGLGTNVSFYMKDSLAVVDIISGGFDTTDGQWHYYNIIFDGDWMFIYIDGIFFRSKDTLLTNVRDSDDSLRIGSGWGQYFGGLIDEVRLSDIGRSPAWIKTSYESQRDHLNNFGVEELLPSRLSVELPVALTSPEVEVRLR